MANITSRAKGGTSPVGIASSNLPTFIGKYEEDIAALVAAGLLTTEYTVLINIPANSKLIIHSLINHTALSMGASPAISLGDSSSGTLFVNASTTVTSGSAHTLTATATTGKVYTAADTLRLNLTGGTLATGTIGIVYQLIDLSRNAIATA